MRIGIDGRYIHDHFPGIGRYTYNLIKGLAMVAREGDFVVFHNPRLLNTRYDVELLARDSNVELVPVDVPTFSLKEQYRLPSLAKRLGLGLLHSPYYIKPYWLPCPSVVTFYDIIPLLYPQYLPSPWGKPLFKLTARLALGSAAAVITISQSAATTCSLSSTSQRANSGSHL
jgi:glycosyltransferase involved in cell wall biosynthesis